MDQGTLRILVTVLSFVAFLGIVWWAWGRSRRARFDEAAKLPFAEGDEAMQRRTIAADRERRRDEQAGSADGRTRRESVSQEEN